MPVVCLGLDGFILFLAVPDTYTPIVIPIVCFQIVKQITSIPIEPHVEVDVTIEHEEEEEEED